MLHSASVPSEVEHALELEHWPKINRGLAACFGRGYNAAGPTLSAAFRFFFIKLRTVSLG